MTDELAILDEVDWLARWQAKAERRRQQVEALAGPQAGMRYWDQRADQFRRLSEQHRPDGDLLLQLIGEALGDGGTVLDVGAGAGRYALPLAGRADFVTAVEPSAAMGRHLQERAEQAGVRNLRLVASTWEDVDVPPHDVVLAAHILYPIADVAPFVRKLVAHARRAWFITIRVEPMGAELAPLWQQVWRTPYPVEPTFLDLYPLLFALGLRPNARMMPFAVGGGGMTFADALAQARGRLFLTADDHRHDEALAAFLRTHLQEDASGWHWPGNRQQAVIYADV